MSLMGGAMAQISLLAPILAASVAAIGAYIAASRRLSGKIDTSEAGQLWAESASIREDYRNRISIAEARTLSLEQRVATLERDNSELARENGSLSARNLLLQHKMDELRGRFDDLEEKNMLLRETIAALREREQGA